MVDEDKQTETETAAVVEPPKDEPPTPLPTVTSAAEWRRKARACFLVPLPSGAVVKAQLPDWNMLILSGVIKQEQMLDIQANDEFSEERYKRMSDMAAAVVSHVVIEPIIVASNGHAPEDDAEFISVDQMPAKDLTTLLYWATGVRALPGVRETER